jgi:UDP-3-O-[3-hydroxymyristoyl] glucosamine N-acyltransferase
MKLAEIAESLGAELEGDGNKEIRGLQPLEDAEAQHLSFLSNPRYAAKLKGTRAGALIVGRDVDGPGCALLRVDDAYVGFAMALEIFKRPLLLAAGVAASADIASDAQVGEGARIAAQVTIGARSRIGARVTLHPGVRIYPDVTIGDDFVAHANAVVREGTKIGDRVQILSGAAIGTEGFGNIPIPGGGVHTLPQIGHVEIGDDVSIGANTTIDRATIGVTRIESGVKLDNLVMVAHGCTIRRDALIAAQVGLAGSTIVGRRVQLGGQAGAAGHLTIGDDVRAAGRTGVQSDVPDGELIAGFPWRPAREWRREEVAIRRLPSILKRLRRLERRSETD